MIGRMLTAVLICAVCAGAWAGQNQYTVAYLGALYGSYSEARGINDAGQVVGDGYPANGNAFLYSNGTMQDLGTFGGEGSCAYGINNAGQIAGVAWGHAIASSCDAFLYGDGQARFLGLGDGAICPVGINNAGQVVGISSNSVTIDAVLCSNGIKQDLGNLGGPGGSMALSINDAGQVVGSSNTANLYDHAFLYSNGLMQDLDPSSTVDSRAVAINNPGQIVGTLGTYRGFLYNNGQMQVMDSLGGRFCKPYDINDAGQVVGLGETYDGLAHAFLCNDGNMIDLNTLVDLDSLLDPSSSLKGCWASAINNVGQIVINGIDSTAGRHAFLLTPVPEPMSLSLLTLGGFALLRRARVEIIVRADRLMLGTDPHGQTQKTGLAMAPGTQRRVF